MKIILRTRCGCERVVHMGAPGRVIIIPLKRPETGNVADFLRVELEHDGDGNVSVKRSPLKFDERRFRRRAGLVERGMPVYVEVPG